MQIVKKIVVVLLLLSVAAVALASCMPNTTTTGTEYRLVMIGSLTDVTEKTGDDTFEYKDEHSLNGSIWHEIREYREVLNIKYYTPSFEVPAADAYNAENGDGTMDLRSREGKIAAVKQQIDVARSAKPSGKNDPPQILVLSGPYAMAAYTYSGNGKPANEDKDAYFIFVDVEMPEHGVLVNNSAAIVFDNTEYGYLYGTIAAKLGYEKIGFVGYSNTMSQNIVAGMQQAEGVDVTYTFIESINEAKAAADKLYDEGVEIVLAENYAMTKSVIESAEAKGKKVMGIGADMSALSDTVVFSLEKDIKKDLSELLIQAKNGGSLSAEATEYGSEKFILCRGKGADALTDEDYQALQEEASAKDLSDEMKK